MIKSTNCLPSDALRNALASDKNITIIDVRHAEEYSERHIPEALNIPLTDLENASRTFNAAHLYVTVCGKGGGRSEQGAEILRSKGFRALSLCLGTAGWYAENSSSTG